MERIERVSIILKLLDYLRERGSWSGETHIQKSVFLLQELEDVQLGFKFILYKHGPFSFDLRNELTSMRADGLLRFQILDPHGPRLLVSDSGKILLRRFNRKIKGYFKSIDRISKIIGKKGVAELERLATALYVVRNFNQESPEENANFIHQLKPHIEEERAMKAIEEIVALGAVL